MQDIIFYTSNGTQEGHYVTDHETEIIKIFKNLYVEKDVYKK